LAGKWRNSGENFFFWRYFGRNCIYIYICIDFFSIQKPILKCGWPKKFDFFANYWEISTNFVLCFAQNDKYSDCIDSMANITQCEMLKIENSVVLFQKKLVKAQYNTILYYTIQYNTMQYNYNTIQFNIIKYDTI